MTNGDATALPSADPGSGPVLTPEDIAEDAQRRAETYSQGDRHGVAVVDGFGARVIVERGHLELHDGVGPDRRVRRYPKIDPPRRVAIGDGTEGIVSLDALRWCSQVGTALVALSNDGAILASGPPAREDARLLRAQALALYGPAGLAVTQYLVGEKVQGQSQLVLLDLDEDEASEVLDELHSEIERADSIEAVRQLEAAAANVYFAAWERKVEATFVRKDLHRIPAHWSRFNGRRSWVNPGTARSATDPAGAVLNYSYKLAEIEASMAARRMGLDPGIGILHADFPGRPSFACDVMEAVRPAVDRRILDVLDGPLLKREFTEDARGVVRCLSPLTHRLAEAMPSYGVVLAPGSNAWPSSSPSHHPTMSPYPRSSADRSTRRPPASGRARDQLLYLLGDRTPAVCPLVVDVDGSRRLNLRSLCGPAEDAVAGSPSTTTGTSRGSTGVPSAFPTGAGRSGPLCTLPPGLQPIGSPKRRGIFQPTHRPPERPGHKPTPASGRSSADGTRRITARSWTSPGTNGRSSLGSSPWACRPSQRRPARARPLRVSGG